MSDELNPYPGNLRHHTVPAKEERAKILIDMMNDDQKDELYEVSRAELSKELDQLVAACHSFQGAYSLCSYLSEDMDEIWSLADQIIYLAANEK